MKKIHLLLFASGAVMIFLAFYFNGTCDSGDSVHHYLIARYAFAHPEKFFDHWAKPVFVLFAAPWAQLGFIGIKLFNVICFLMTQLFIYKIAVKLDCKSPLLPALVWALFPLNIYTTLSGLTEPLFACWLAIGIFLLLAEKDFAGSLFLSFLPFVRSEGLVILCVVAVYFLITKKWKWIPLLIAGHFIYGFAGLHYHQNIFWTFSENPYATTQSVYGSGAWNSFIIKLPWIIGLAFTILLPLGILLEVFFQFNILKTNSAENIWKFKNSFLIVGCFAAFFSFHSYAWATGSFKSFGLLRVMVGIMPCIALICCQPIEYAVTLFPKQKIFIQSGILILAFILLLIPNNFSLHKNQFELHADQLAINEASDFIRKNYPDYKGYHFFYDATYIAMALHQDIFSERKTMVEFKTFSQLPKKSFVIWDDWFAPVEGKIQLDELKNDRRLKMVKGFYASDEGGERAVILFETVE